MAKDIAISCPLCLGAHDPADIVSVSIQRVIPPGKGSVGICRRCLRSIIVSAILADYVLEEEVAIIDPYNTRSRSGTGTSLDSAEAGSDVVVRDNPSDPPSVLDRREPELPAGGEDGANKAESVAEGRGVTPSEPEPGDGNQQ